MPTTRVLVLALVLAWVAVSVLAIFPEGSATAAPSNAGSQTQLPPTAAAQPAQSGLASLPSGHHGASRDLEASVRLAQEHPQIKAALARASADRSLVARK